MGRLLEVVTAELRGKDEESLGWLFVGGQLLEPGGVPPELYGKTLECAVSDRTWTRDWCGDVA